MDANEKRVQEILAERKSGTRQGARGPIGPGSPPVDTQFKPGQSGNPAGMPKGTVSLLTHLKKFLAETPEGERRTRAEMLSEQTWKDAMRGDSAARKLCWEYIDGGATQRVELTGADGGPITYADLTDKPDAEVIAEAEAIARRAAEADRAGGRVAKARVRKDASKS